MEIGKTTRLLRATPAGGVFVVHSEQMIKYVNQWLVEEGRDKDNISVVSIDQFNEKISAERRPVTIDHFVTDEACNFISRDDQFTLAAYCSHSAPYVISLDRHGNIKTRWTEQ